MPGITVYTSSRLEHLVQMLEGHLKEEEENLCLWDSPTIVVPTQGLGLWVKQYLARGRGSAPAGNLPFVGNFLANLLVDADAAAGEPFAKDVLELRLYRLLDDATLRNQLGPANEYCRDDATGLLRLQLATRLARVFDDYQLQRADLLERAGGGDDLAELGPHGQWQAELWRALLRDAESDASQALRLAAVRQRLADPQRRARLPNAIHVFGVGTLPPAYLQTLQRVGELVPVFLYVPLPSVGYLGDVRGRRPEGVNPLLARFGKAAAEFAQLLEEQPETAVTLRPLDDTPDIDRPRPTLLERLQVDIEAVADRSDGVLPRYVIAADDDSLTIHDCHSPMREMEVVRDRILAAFAADATLLPHEVLVLVTDVATYAPYAQAAFGPFSKHLPFRIADRNPADELPMCALVLRILAMADGRNTLGEALGLLQAPAVQRRFELPPDSLPTLQQWLDRAGVRWGESGSSRQQRHDLGDFEQNSWRFGLQRLVLGAAVGPDDTLYGGVLACADGTSSRTDLLDKLLAFTDTLQRALAQLRNPCPAAEWADRLDRLRETMLQAGPEDQAAAQRLLEAAVALRRLAEAAKLTEEWTDAVFAAWLRQHLEQASGGSGFLSGSVTVASLQPMRMVPHRHVFVCGLSDLNFPRRDQALPFDLTAVSRRRGDRSRRLDDRQLFLDAILATRTALHLTYVGRSLVDDSVCVPSTVVRETLDYLAASCTVEGGGKVGDRLVVRHPLQPWSPAYRDGTDRRLFTYAPSAATATGAATGAFAAELPRRIVDPPAQLSLDELTKFWREPAKRFVQDGLCLRLPEDDEHPSDDEPFEVAAGLPTHRVVAPLLQARLRGEADLDAEFLRARAEGELPVGGSGAQRFYELAQESEDAARRALADDGKVRELAVRAHLGATEIVATGLLAVGDVALLAARSSGDRYELRLWIQHQLLATARGQGAPDLPKVSRFAHRDGIVELGELDPEPAQRRLQALVDGYAMGATRPLPFAPKASRTYLKALAKQPDDERQARHKARKTWLEAPPNSPVPAEGESPANRLAWRGADPVDDAEFAEWAEAAWGGFDDVKISQRKGAS